MFFLRNGVGQVLAELVAETAGAVNANRQKDSDFDITELSLIEHSNPFLAKN
jgi:hypothetical protein